MAIIVGSFTLQLPTSASVATLLAFAKPWHYRMFGGNFFTFDGFENFFCSRSLTMDKLLLYEIIMDTQLLLLTTNH